MAVAFSPSQIIGRGDLDIFLTNNVGNPTNASDIYYALYYVDPDPPNAEALVGDPQRIPVNPTVGEYYAALMVPSSATVGTYRIRWTFRELVSSPYQQVVQEFAVVGVGSVIVAPTYSVGVQEMITHLRKLLRDQCVGGEETVELDVNGERMVVRMDDLWEVLQAESRQ